MNAFIVDTKIYTEIVADLKCSAGPKKIAAIKRLRKNALGYENESVGLREAKQSVERLMHELGLGNYPNLDGAARICSGPRIKKIVVDFGEGDVEIDIETMQLKILSQLQTIGIDACGQMLELVQTIKAFSEGRRIGVIDIDNE